MKNILKKLITFHLKSDHQVNSNRFYQTLRPVMIFKIFLGTCTLSNVWSGDGKNLKHKRFGVTLLWPLMVGFWNFYLCVNPKREPHIMINIFLHCVRTIVNLILIHQTDPNLLETITKIEDFDKFYSYKPATSSNIRGCLWFLVSFIIYISFSCLVFNMVGVTLRTVYFSTFDIQARYMTVILFIMFCNELTIRFNFLSKQWKAKEKEIITFQQEDVINEIRVHHGELKLIADSISNSCGIRIITFVFSMTFEVIINFFYGLDISSRNIFSMSIYTAFDSVIFLILLTASSNLKEKSNHILIILSQLPISKFTMSCQSQVELFMTQGYVKQIEISAKGYFTLERSFITSIIMTCATYFMLSIQLQDEIYDTLREIYSIIREIVYMTRIPIPPLNQFN